MSMELDNLEWSYLHAQFLSLADKTGIGKMSSYTMDISFDTCGEVSVHLGTYDIGDWDRHTYLGPFRTEAEAFAATREKIFQAKQIVEG